MAELVVSTFMDISLGRIKKLINTYISDQYEYQTVDLKGKLQQMASSFTKIKALVDVAGKMDIEENESLVEWLSELKNAVYDAEYVMDVFEYQRLKNEVEGWPQMTQLVKDKGKVRRFFKFSSKVQERASVVAKRLFFADEELNDLLRVVAKFDSLVKDMNNFTNLLQLHHAIQHLVARPVVNVDQEMESRVTTSVPIESKLFGRDEVETELLELLLKFSDRNETTSFSVVSVVGVGGVGKTSLAQVIFNHPSVTDYFDVKAWVCVSSNFNIASLTRDIIEDARINKPSDYNSFTTLGRIQDVLMKGLQSKKFLIVMDDVWEDMHHDKWEKMSVPLRNGKEGSKILVTSRDHNIAKIMGAQKKMHIDLSPLKFEHYWQFFKKCAFRYENPENYPRLKKIGEGIAQKLGGLPLAAKTVGRVLSTNLSIDHWNNVLNSKVWKEENGVMSALKLSYDHLPIHLKKCIVFCCLFPKDYNYTAETLVNIWIALDCVRPDDKHKRLVDIKKAYINELVNRCFFDVSPKLSKDENYVMHDLLHDLAEKIIGHEVYRVEDEESLSMDASHSQCVRHLYVKSTTYCGFDLVLQKLNIAPKQLRSLVYVVNYKAKTVDEWKIKMSEETIQVLKGLRLLIFNNVQHMRMWQNIGDLLHLRHASLGSILFFPDSFWKLHQLETLQWQEAFGETKRCNHLHKLISLRYANKIGRFSNPEIITSYLGGLKSLEVVPGGKFTIDEEMGNDIGQFRELNKIGGEVNLFVHVKLSEVEARKADLNRKQYLTELAIIDKYNEEDEEGGINDKAIEALQPHQNLEKLRMEGCRSITAAPTWLLVLSNLTTLSLSKLTNLQILPPHLGYQLSSLKYLYLQSLPSMKHIDIDDHPDLALFPTLTHVTIRDMINFEGWSLHNSCCNETTRKYPKLSTVEIYKCPKLLTKEAALPNRVTFPFPSLNCNISLQLCPTGGITGNENMMTQMATDEQSLLPATENYDEHKISMLLGLVKELIIFDYDMAGMINILPTTLSQKFQSLELLSIHDCDDMESLDNIASHLPPAKKMIISRCSKLKFLSAANNGDSILMLPCLESLVVRSCHNLVFLFLRTQFPSLGTLFVEQCRNLRSLTGDNIDDDISKAILASVKTLIIKECPKLELPPAITLLIEDIRRS